MLDRHLRCSRRKFLASAAALTLAGGISSAEGPDAPPSTNRGFTPPGVTGRKPLAVVTTVYRPLSHSYHIAGRFLYGYTLAGQPHVPKFHIASLYVDQAPDNDLSRDLVKDFGVRVTRSISDALLVDGKLAVEGVLLIGEHGNYPRNDKGQILYPRLEMMEQIAAVFRKAGRSVPVFSDKHLSYTFAKAQKMIGWSDELKFPLMAGSSLPVTWRRPELELRLDSPIEEGLVACYGPLEVYGFHGLEALQVMMERRKGGETGVKAVTCLVGKEVWKAGDAGRWSWDLAGRRLEPQRDGQPRRRPPERRQHERSGDAAGAGHRVPRRVPRRLARHGADAQRPRPGFLLRWTHQGRGQAGVVSLRAAAAAGGEVFRRPGVQHRKDAGDGQIALPDPAHAANDRRPRRGHGKPRPPRRPSGDA